METMTSYTDKQSQSICDGRHSSQWMTHVFSGVESGILDLRFLVAIGSAVWLQTVNRKVLKLDEKLYKFKMARMILI